VVTVAALYGADGSVIGPRVAERLGVEFLDRAIPASVARQAGVPETVVDAHDDQPRSAVTRLVGQLARVPASPGASPLERTDLEERNMLAQIEEFLARASVSGGVVLGRGGAVVLSSVARALHVYLGGAEEARIERVMEREGIDRASAARQLKAHDRARRQYVQRAYGVDGDDPGLYHLMMDSLAFGVDACVDLIVAASQLRIQRVAEEEDAQTP
jgi:cytidylate kinase